jgi:hypothetical protein
METTEYTYTTQPVADVAAAERELALVLEEVCATLGALDIALRRAVKHLPVVELEE